MSTPSASFAVTAPEGMAIGLRLLAPDVYWRHAWDVAGDRYPRPAPPAQTASGDGRVRRELLFCLLGGHGITYELNVSATEVLWQLGLLRDWRPTVAHLERELSRAQFAPCRRDGTGRSYRYPARKARLLSGAAEWLAQTGPLLHALKARSSERDRRSLLCECPGMGPKSASWLLRNCGLAERLAILDVHVLRVMRESGRIPGDGARSYDQLEEAFISWCDELGADPGGFDMLLWEWSRAARS